MFYNHDLYQLTKALMPAQALKAALICIIENAPDDPDDLEYDADSIQQVITLAKDVSISDLEAASVVGQMLDLLTRIVSGELATNRALRDAEMKITCLMDQGGAICERFTNEEPSHNSLAQCGAAMLIPLMVKMLHSKAQGG